ncbi:MAG: hypothetical protein JNK49_06925 [Planctomycetes bacterium]|nr:hypothetical protein [Planctomycetota bacterium]
MNQPQPDGRTAAPAFVEDLFLTDVFLIKGRLPNKAKRLSSLLEDWSRAFLPVHDATLVALRSGEVIRTPTVMVALREVLFAHELIEVAGDAGMQKLGAGAVKSSRIRAFYNGPVQFELAGRIEPGAYESQPLTGRKFFIMDQPELRGLDLQHPDLAVLRGLEYAIVRKDRMAYVYDFR